MPPLNRYRGGVSVILVGTVARSSGPQAFVVVRPDARVSPACVLRVGDSMYRFHSAVAPGLVLVLVALGCGDSTSTSPVAPTAVRPSGGASLDTGPAAGLVAAGLVGAGALSDLSAAAVSSPDFSATDGVTLKATSPDPVSPAGDAETRNIRVTLVTANATARYVDVVVPFTYRFELFAGGMTPVHAGTEEQGVDTTAYSVPLKLETRRALHVARARRVRRVTRVHGRRTRRSARHPRPSGRRFPPARATARPTCGRSCCR